jgi:hypothetical protein
MEPNGRGGKYYCDYCRIYVQNNKVNINQHERNKRHLNLKEKYLKTQYKKKDLLERQIALENKILGKPVVKKPVKVEKKTINPELYGLGAVDMNWNKADYKASEEFNNLNSKVLVAEIGDWIPDSPKQSEAAAILVVTPAAIESNEFSETVASDISKVRAFF